MEKSIVPIWNLVASAAAEFKLPYRTKGVALEIDFSPLLYEHSDLETPPQRTRDANDLPADIRENRVVGDAVRLTQGKQNCAVCTATDHGQFHSKYTLQY